MPRCYMVKKGTQRHDGPPPCSPTEATVAPPCYSPAQHSALTEPRGGECSGRAACEETGAEAGAGAGARADVLAGRSAADTEAAHDLLSLAQSLPPLPPAAVVTVLDPAPLLPLYTYTLQPAKFYILAEKPRSPVYQTFRPIAPRAPEPPLQQLQPNQTSEETQTDYIETEEVEALPFETQDCIEIEADLSSSEDAPQSPEQPESQGKKTAKYDCNECGKRYATSSNLSRHKQTHRSLDSGSARRCEECGKAYVSMPALAMHVLTHRMGHVCGLCGKQFSRPWLLRGHLRSHTGEKPYRCSSCGKAFADRSNLRAHLQTHSTDKKHECLRCRKTFALKSYLNKHQEAGCVRADED